MKNFLLALLPNLTTKAAVTAAVCAVAGATAAATVTTVVYKNKEASYEQTIDALETGADAVSAADKAAGDGSASATAVRVVDGILEVWDGTQWQDYGPVDDIESGDPFYENDEKREQLEKSVAEKKLDELGLKINENGEIVKKEEGDQAAVLSTGKNDSVILVGSVKGNKNTAENKKSNDNGNNKTAGTTASANAAAVTVGQVPAAPAATQTISSMPMAADSSVTTVSWTAEPSPYDNDSGGGSSHHHSDDGGGSSDSGGGESYSAPAPSESSSSSSESQSSPEPQQEAPSEPEPQPNPEPAFDEGGDDDCGDDVK